jgi:hypothetical protein
VGFGGVDSGAAAGAAGGNLKLRPARDQALRQGPRSHQGKPDRRTHALTAPVPPSPPPASAPRLRAPLRAPGPARDADGGAVVRVLPDAGEDLVVPHI